jgi:hypothetical protein
VRDASAVAGTARAATVAAAVTVARTIRPRLPDLTTTSWVVVRPDLVSSRTHSRAATIARDAVIDSQVVP